MCALRSVVIVLVIYQPATLGGCPRMATRKVASTHIPLFSGPLFAHSTLARLTPPATHPHTHTRIHPHSQATFLLATAHTPSFSRSTLPHRPSPSILLSSYPPAAHPLIRTHPPQQPTPASHTLAGCHEPGSVIRPGKTLIAWSLLLSPATTSRLLYLRNSVH